MSEEEKREGAPEAGREPEASAPQDGSAEPAGEKAAGEPARNAPVPREAEQSESGSLETEQSKSGSQETGHSESGQEEIAAESSRSAQAEPPASEAAKLPGTPAPAASAEPSAPSTSAEPPAPSPAAPPAKPSGEALVRRQETDEEKAARRKAALEAREAAKAAAAQAGGARPQAAPPAAEGGASAADPPSPPPAPSPNQSRLDRAAQLLRELVAEDAVIEASINEPNDHLPTLVIRSDRWHASAELFRHHPELNIDYLRNVAGVDHETHMEVVYHLLSLSSGHVYAVKVRTDREQPSVPSATPIWPTANWPEREIYDLLGIDFPGHPDLRRIMMPDDWVGHPLRKDYVPLDPEV